jgi:hypothetical protein
MASKKTAPPKVERKGKKTTVTFEDQDQIDEAAALGAERTSFPLSDEEVKEREQEVKRLLNRLDARRRTLADLTKERDSLRATLDATPEGQKLSKVKEEIKQEDIIIAALQAKQEVASWEVVTKRTFEYQRDLFQDDEDDKGKAPRKAQQQDLFTPPAPSAPPADGPSTALATTGPRRATIIEGEFEPNEPSLADDVQRLLRAHGPLSVERLCVLLGWEERDSGNWAKVQEALRRCGATSNRGIWHLPDQVHVLPERAGEVPVEEPAEAAPAAPEPPALPALPPAPPVSVRELFGALKNQLSRSEAELAHALGTTSDAVKAGLQPLTDAKCVEIVPGVEENYYRLPLLRDLVLGLVRRTPGVRLAELLEQASAWKASEIEGKVDALTNQGAIVVRGEQHYLPENAPPEGPKGGKKGKAKPAKGKDTKALGKSSPKARPASVPTPAASFTDDTERLVLDVLREGGELDTLEICRRAGLRHNAGGPALGRLLEAKRVSRTLNDGRYFWLLSESTEVTEGELLQQAAE